MNKIMYWLPRIISILFIIFILMFSFDVFSMEGAWLEKAGGFLIHNIPTIILTLLLIFSWKNERKGGCAFIILGLFFTFFFRTYERADTFLLISFPAILIGFLFLLNKNK